MSQSNRRDILKRGVLAAARRWGPWACHRPAAIPPIGRTRPSHLKLSIAAYSYRDYLAAKPPDGPVRLRQPGRRHGARRHRADVVLLPARRRFDAYLHRLKQHAFMLGLDISGTAIGNNFCLPPGPERDEQLALARTWIDRAAELDAPVIRIFAGNVPKGATEEPGGRLGDRGDQGVVAARRREGGHAGPREPRRDHGDPRADPQAGQGGRRPELRREPRHRQFPRRGPLRRDRRARPLCRQRPGEDRDPAQGAKAKEEADLAPDLASSATPGTPATSSSSTRPPKTRSRPSRGISRSCAN